MKKLLKLINVRDLVTNVAAATIILSLIACGGGMTGIVPGIVSATSRVAHLITIPTSGHRIAPNTSGRAFEAAMFFQSAPTPSQLAQSYDLQCTISTFLAAPANSLIPIPGLLQVQQGPDICNLFETTPTPQQDGNGGKQTFFAGTLTSLVVTGTTQSKTPFQCRDIVNTLAVPDNSYTQAYLDTTSHTVKIFNQEQNLGTVTQVPFTCTGIGTDTDPVATIEVQFAKQ
jgi:hypothetical protein